MKTKTKKESFPIYPIEAWGVEKYGVSLFINNPQSPLFLDGVSLDVEDDEQGNFVGLGIYGKSVMGGLDACYYWSDFALAKRVIIPKFIAHNGLSDIRKLQNWGFKIDESWLILDTQLMGHILDSSRKAYGLKKLVKEDLGIEYPSYDDIVGKRTEKQTKPRITLDKQPLELVSQYNAMDCYTTYKLYEKQQVISGYNSNIAYFSQIEKPAAIVFEAMEQKGIRIDVPYLQQLRKDLEKQREIVANQLHNELGTINLNSPKQLLGALNAKGIQPNLKGKPSTDKRALEGFRNTPIVKNLLAFSELETLLTSFVLPYLERGDEVVHPRFNQCGTRTGRPSCSNPNLLQIPKRTENGKLVRRMFVAREGNLLGDCDFGQIEPRIMAHLSQDKDMCEMFNTGTDFHTFTSERLNISRDRAKILNLSVGYRATFKSVSQQLKCGYDSAQREIDKWWDMFPQLHDWQQALIYDAKKKGYCTTLMGRRIKVDDLSNPNQWRREGAERQLINNIAQGSAAEVMKKAMIAVHKEGIDILVQVYDALLFETMEEAMSSDVEIVVEKMINTTKLLIPLTVDSGIGKNWSECHDK